MSKPEYQIFDENDPDQVALAVGLSQYRPNNIEYRLKEEPPSVWKKLDGYITSYNFDRYVYRRKLGANGKPIVLEPKVPNDDLAEDRRERGFSPVPPDGEKWYNPEGLKSSVPEIGSVDGGGWLGEIRMFTQNEADALASLKPDALGLLAHYYKREGPEVFRKQPITVGGRFVIDRGKTYFTTAQFRRDLISKIEWVVPSFLEIPPVCFLRNKIEPESMALITGYHEHYGRKYFSLGGNILIWASKIRDTFVSPENILFDKCYEISSNKKEWRPLLKATLK